MVTEAKMLPTDDMEILELEPPHASTKSKEIKEVSLGLDKPSKNMKIGAHLDPKWESVLVSFLHANADVFAWKPTDMSGVPREKIEHSLNVSPTAKPIKQKLHRFALDKNEAIRVEIKQLLAVGFIKEVYHPKWLANPNLVQNKE